MTITIVLDESWEIETCLRWSARLAKAAKLSLTVAVVSKAGQHQVRAVTGEAEAKSGRLAAEVFEVASQKAWLQVEAAVNAEVDGQSRLGESSASGMTAAMDSSARPALVGPIPTRVVEVSGPDLAESILEFARISDTRALILPRHAKAGGLEEAKAWEQAVYRTASCETMLLRPGQPAEPSERAGDESTSSEQREGANQDAGALAALSVRSVLASIDDGRASGAALTWAGHIRDYDDAELTALYVEPDVGELAPEVGQRIVRRAVTRTLGSAKDTECRVAIGESVRQTIVEVAKESEFDLIVLGANRLGYQRRWLKSSISDWVLAQPTDATVLVVRPAIPFAHRMTARVRLWMERIVPQLDREARVSLFERIQSSSRWDFDFIALICLSTIIASLGLIQNSGAVVIGAMLVAPLMTPLVGAGLALVQGNRIFIWNAFATVLRGFLLAFGLAFLLGLFVPGLQESREMLSRGSPNLLDFAIALISGIAASYALGRPNLYSALPGVAIAAALVPPVATAGMALALGNIGLACGALLLFATNIVAIVLGTDASLYAVGIRASHEHGVVESWTYRMAAVFLVVALIIGAYEYMPHHSLSEKLQTRIEQLLEEHDGARLVDAHHASSDRVLLNIEAAQPLPKELQVELAKAVRGELGEQLRVELETRLVSVDLPSAP